MKQSPSPNGLAYAALAVTSLVWGTTWVASKIAVSEVPAFQLAAIRQFIAGCCFLGYFLLVKKASWPTLRELRNLFVLSLLMMVMANGLSTWGLRYIPTGFAALIGALYPLSVVFLEKWLYRKKALSPLALAGLILGLAGVAYVFYAQLYAQLTPVLLGGVGLSLIAMLSWSLGTVFLSRHHLSVSPYYSMGWQMLMGSLMMALLSVLLHDPIPLGSVSIRSWIAILYLVGAGSVLSFIAFIYTLKRFPPQVSTLYAYMNPLVAAITGSVLLDEQISASTIVGTFITLSGVFLVNYSLKREPEDLVTESEI